MYLLFLSSDNTLLYIHLYLVVLCFTVHVNFCFTLIFSAIRTVSSKYFTRLINFPLFFLTLYQGLRLSCVRSISVSRRGYILVSLVVWFRYFMNNPYVLWSLLSGYNSDFLWLLCLDHLIAFPLEFSWVCYVVLSRTLFHNPRSKRIRLC